MKGLIPVVVFPQCRSVTVLIPGGAHADDTGHHGNAREHYTGALISKTVEGLMRAQVGQTSAQPVNAPESGPLDVYA